MENKSDSDENEQCLCSKDQALQYYLKFGRQRNLEKYMRLQHHVQSPCSFGMFEDQQPHCSTALNLQESPLKIGDDDKKKNTSSPTKEKQEFAEIEIPIEKEELVGAESTKSPTKSTQTDIEDKVPQLQKSKTLASTSSSDGSQGATLIRIFKESIEAELISQHKKSKSRSEDATVSEKEEAEKAETDDDSFRTPQHSQKLKEKRKQKNTPDSAAKSHRRLEWDSWGDVGYGRSKSSSNISVLERLVLNQLLQDCGMKDASEQEKRLFKSLLLPKDGQMTRAKSLDSPPLASSTHISHTAIRSEQQGTSPEQMEKCVQTTISRKKKKSQKVQVDLSSTTSSENKSKSAEGKLDSLEKMLEEKLDVMQKIKLTTESESSIEKQIVQSLNDSPTIETKTDSDISSKISHQSTSPEYNVAPIESLLETMSTDSFQVIMETNSLKEPEIGKTEEKQSVVRTKNLTDAEEEKGKKQYVNSYERSLSWDEGSSNAYMLHNSKSHAERNFPLEDMISSITNKSSTREDQEEAFKKFQKSLENQLAYNSTKNSARETTQSRPRSRQSAQLELGIQLLCELIEARSLSISQKEKLLNDVVRRICNKTGTKPENEMLAVNSELRPLTINPQTLQTSFGRKSSTNTRSQENSINPNAHLCAPSTSAVAAAAAAKLALASEETHTTVPRDSSANFDGPRNLKQNEISITNAENIQINNINVMPTSVTEKVREHESQPRSRAGAESVASKSSTSTDHSVKMSSKDTSEAQNNDNKEEAISKPSWLLPTTHSEFEYEHRKGLLAINADKRHAIIQHPSLYEMSGEKRGVLINWLDMEINRLDRLRQLMLSDKSLKTKPSSSTTTSTSTENLIRISTYNPIKEQAKKPKEAVYDKVMSSMSSDRANAQVDKRRQKQQQSSENEANIIELVIEESKENMRTKARLDDKIKYTQPAIKLGTLRERNSSLISTNSKIVKTPAEESSHSTTSSRATKVVQQRSKMATPSSSIRSSSVNSFEGKNNVLHTMATQTSGGAEQGTQTRPICQCIHKEMVHNNYHYPYHACQHQRNYNMLGWNCCRYYTTPMTQDVHYVQQTTATTTTAATTKTTSKTTQAGMTKKSAQTQITPSNSSSSSSSSHIISSGSSSLRTYNMPADASQQQEKSSSSAKLSGVISSSDVSIPMGVNGNGSNSTTTTTHQYDDLDSMERQPLRHNMAVQTSSTLLFRQLPEEVAPGLQSTPIRLKPKSVAYVLEFSTSKPNRTSWKYKSNATDKVKQDEGEHKSEDDVIKERMTLQAHLEHALPSFVAHTKQRKAVLQKLQVLRQQREKELREIIENTSINSIERKLTNIPPPAIAQVRLFSTVQMKALTKKRARKLPEVLDREYREREERRRRGNRLMRDLFNNRLQKRVRVGKISLNHSKTVI